MSRVSVITGGAGGMGLATAKIVGREYAVVLCDVRQDRLDAAATTLKDLGVTATVVNCDVTDRPSVTALFETAAGLGTVASVIHTAGVSPSMGDADYVMRTNAVGTVNVNEVFYATAGEGSAIVNVASVAAHMLPESLIPTGHFPLALRDADAFMAEMTTACSIAPDDARSGFGLRGEQELRPVVQHVAVRTVHRSGLRIVSVSPGSVDTEMGRLEEQAGAGAMVTDAAVPRWGTAEEMAELFAFCASDKAGYLTGTDILNDGGVTASMTERARATAENG